MAEIGPSSVEPRKDRFTRTDSIAVVAAVNSPYVEDALKKARGLCVRTVDYRPKLR
jgi:hypothetical protein